MHIFQPHLRPYTIIALSYLVIFTMMAVINGNSEFIFYLVTMMLIISGIVYMDKRVSFSAVVLSGLTLWGFAHLAGGLVPIPANWTMDDAPSPVLYNMRLSPFMPRYDQIVHAFGFGMSLLAAREALQVHLKRPLPVNFPLGVTFFLIAMGLGAFNEVIEFIAVLSIPNTNVGGYTNTGWDLVSNACGALLALMYLKLNPVKT